MPKRDSKEQSAKARITVEAILGRHGDEGAITIDATEDGKRIGKFSIAHGGIEFKGTRMMWSKVADFFDEEKKRRKQARKNKQAKQ
jgi:hypothetical protein